jgi:hypothetical protein
VGGKTVTAKCPACDAASEVSADTVNATCRVCGKLFPLEAPDLKTHEPIPPAREEAASTEAMRPEAASAGRARFCPRCGAPSPHVERRGYAAGLGCLGFILLPPIGLLLGYSGAKNLEATCLACGHHWRPFASELGRGSAILIPLAVVALVLIIVTCAMGGCAGTTGDPRPPRGAEVRRVLR